MKRICIIILGIIAITLTGCDQFNRKHQVGTVAEVNGQYLFPADIANVTRGLTGADSAEAADAFIRQWATEILIYDKAQADIDPQLEALVEDYRRSLYVHQYEKQWLNHNDNYAIDTALVNEFYASHISDYVLNQTIVRGILVIVPNGTPNQNKMQKWLQEPNEDNLELLEKYCYQYSSRYQLFTDQWITKTQLQLWLPNSATDLDKRIKQQHQLVFTDSLSTYVLQLTDIRLAGSPMPIEYAQPDIEKVLRHERQMALMQKERTRIYDEAVRFKKIKLYEK